MERILEYKGYEIRRNEEQYNSPVTLSEITKENYSGIMKASSVGEAMDIIDRMTVLFEYISWIDDKQENRESREIGYSLVDKFIKETM